MATILFLSWLRVAKPDTATGYQLDSITACVVSGVSLQGCRGSILGSATAGDPVSPHVRLARNRGFSYALASGPRTLRFHGRNIDVGMKIQHPLLVRAVGCTGAWLVRRLGRTIRYHFRYEDPSVNPEVARRTGPALHLRLLP